MKRLQGVCLWFQHDTHFMVGLYYNPATVNYAEFMSLAIRPLMMSVAPSTNTQI